MLFLITAQRLIASSKATSFAVQCCRNSFLRVFIFLEYEELAETLLKAFGVKIAFNLGPMADGDDAGFFADNDDDGVGFLAQSESGPMSNAQSAIQIDPLTDRKHTSRRDNPVIADDQAAIVERGFWEKDTHGQLPGEVAIDGDAGLRKAINIGIALDGDQGPELPVGQIKGHFRQNRDGLPTLRDRRKKVVAAESGQGAPKLRLENDDESKGQKRD